MLFRLDPISDTAEAQLRQSRFEKAQKGLDDSFARMMRNIAAVQAGSDHMWWADDTRMSGEDDVYECQRWPFTPHVSRRGDADEMAYEAEAQRQKRQKEVA